MTLRKAKLSVVYDRESTPEPARACFIGLFAERCTVTASLSFRFNCARSLPPFGHAEEVSCLCTSLCLEIASAHHVLFTSLCLEIACAHHACTNIECVLYVQTYWGAPRVSPWLLRRVDMGSPMGVWRSAICCFRKDKYGSITNGRCAEAASIAIPGGSEAVGASSSLPSSASASASHSVC